MNTLRLCALGAAVSLACLFVSCTTGPEKAPPSPHELPPAAPGGSDGGAAGSLQNGLAAPAFRKLPPEAGAYLKTLARAFETHDLGFLIAQGETRYETENRRRYDEETYLAMLYRVGPSTEDNTWKPRALPRLDCREIRTIEYLSWTEQGPLLEIRSRLIPRTGSPIPCEILLAWKLVEPKIEGVNP
jgi:hypothetical protein